MDSQFVGKILECSRLPSPPAVAMRVIDLCRGEARNMRDIADTIATDPALTARILKVANSSLYGLRQPVGTVRHAIVMLGLNSVRVLALGFSFLKSFEGGSHAGDPTALARRSIYAGVGGQLVAQTVGIKQAEEVFIGGLLRDIGLLAFKQVLDEGQISNLSESLSSAAEDGGIDYAELGAALASRWRLPPQIIAQIRYQKRPREAPTDMRPLVYAAAAGGWAASAFLGEKEGAIAEFFHAVNRWFGVDSEAALRLLQRIGHDAREMSALFDLRTEGVRDARSILSEANDVLSRLCLQAQQDVATLEKLHEQLKVQAMCDPLTGVRNRASLEQLLDDLIRRSIPANLPLAAIFCDADDFKSVNDTYGHPAGDRMLISLATLLSAHLRKGATLARYGGDEFVMILPACTRAQAIETAEHTCREVAAMSVPVGDGRLMRMTLSMGVAVYKSFAGRTCAKDLLEDADKALSAAKSAGGNAVRLTEESAEPRLRKTA